MSLWIILSFFVFSCGINENLSVCNAFCNTLSFFKPLTQVEFQVYFLYVSIKCTRKTIHLSPQPWKSNKGCHHGLVRDKNPLSTTYALDCRAGRESHDPCFHVFLMETGVKTFATHCTLVESTNVYVNFWSIKVIKAPQKKPNVITPDSITLLTFTIN